MTDFVISNSIDADTIIKVILDKSGSMGSIRQSTIEGLNAYIDTLKNDPNDDKTKKTRVSIVQFDSSYNGTRLERTKDMILLEDVPTFGLDDFVPRGGTPLYDAVGQIIAETEIQLANVSVKPSVLFVIMTDGDNTDHHGYSATHVKSMIERLQESGWSFVYLGANQDAWSVGGSFGIAKGNAMTYGTNNMQDVMASVGVASAAYRTSSRMMRSVAPHASYQTETFFNDAGQDEKDYNK